MIYPIDATASKERILVLHGRLCAEIGSGAPTLEVRTIPDGVTRRGRVPQYRLRWGDEKRHPKWIGSAAMREALTIAADSLRRVRIAATLRSEGNAKC